MPLSIQRLLCFLFAFCSISSLKEKRAEQKDWRLKINEGLIEEVEENMAV